ncbi:MAG: hypothetical protein IPG93_25735 [Burkholderiales bacterium]|nr:hypothetical protein [Burkholderiales bacterium]
MLQHIGHYSFPSAFLSFSMSFAVARAYALTGPGGLATAGAPGFVYTVDLSQIATAIVLTDPIQGIRSGVSGAFAHDHNGGPALMGEVARGSGAYSAAHQPGGGALETPAVSLALKALIYAIRDAEVLIAATVPRAAVTHRQAVY